MSEIVKAGTPALVSPTGPASSRIEASLAGEALGALDAVYLRATDGRVYRSLNAGTPYTGVTGGVPPQTVHGFVTAAANPGDRVTLVCGNAQATYSVGLIPTTPYYLSGTVPGGLADAPPVAGAPAIAHAASATVIILEWLAGVPRF